MEDGRDPAELSLGWPDSIRPQVTNLALLRIHVSGGRRVKASEVSMRSYAVRLVIVVLLAAWGAFGQSPDQDRVFHFTSNVSAQAMQEAVNVIRTAADVNKVSLDTAGRNLTVTADPARLSIADWLFLQLDQPTGPAVAQYEIAGDATPSMRVFRLAHADTPAVVQEMVNIMRTIAECNRVFPFNSLKAIVVRGTVDKAGMASWLVQQLDLPAGVQPAAVASNPHEYQFQSVRDPAARIFFLQHTDSPYAMQEMVNTVRTLADINRVFPLNGPRAVVARGGEGQVAMAQWLLHELDQAPAKQASESAEHAAFNTYGNDVEARVFHLAHLQNSQAVQEAVTALRTNVQIQRVFPCMSSLTISLRATPEQVGRAEKLIAERDKAQ